VGVASLATNLALQFDCPETGAAHRLACHATIGVALGLQYLAFVRWHEWRNMRRSAHGGAVTAMLRTPSERRQ
jgi:hypothetical protein